MNGDSYGIIILKSINLSNFVDISCVPAMPLHWFSSLYDLRPLQTVHAGRCRVTLYYQLVHLVQIFVVYKARVGIIVRLGYFLLHLFLVGLSIERLAELQRVGITLSLNPAQTFLFAVYDLQGQHYVVVDSVESKHQMDSEGKHVLDGWAVRATGDVC